MITMSVVLAAAVETLDSTIANVALPQMQGELSASADQIAWVLTSYGIATAVGMPFAGWAAERYGRSRILLWATAGFVLASVFCGLSGSMSQIVIGRLIQGFIGAALMPLSQAVIIDIYPPNQLARGFALWSSGVVLAPIIGPTLGGLITDTIGWRWVFFINVPLGAITLLGMLGYMPKSKPKPDKPFDFFGFATFSLAVGLLQALLDRGNQLDWFDSMEIRIEAVISIAMFSYFIIHTATTNSTSFLNRQLLTDINYMVGGFAYMVVVSISTLFRAVLPTLLQGLFLFTALDAGLALGPGGIGALLGVMSFGWLSKRFDGRVIATAGFIFTGAATWWMMGLNLSADFTHIALPGLLQGYGLLLASLPLSIMTFSTLNPNLRNEGSSFFNLFRYLGGSLGIALIQTYLAHHTVQAYAKLSEGITVYSENVHAYLPGILDIQDPLSHAILSGEINRQASMIAYVDAFGIMFLACLVVIPGLLILRSGRNSTEVTH